MRVNEEERGQEEEDLKDKLVIASCKQTVIRSIMKWYRKLELTGYGIIVPCLVCNISVVNTFLHSWPFSWERQHMATTQELGR